MATLKISEVTDLSITTSVAQQKQIIATFKYSTSTSGDYKYFKNFKVAWHYSYKDGSITVNRQDESNPSRDTSSSSQSIYWSLPNLDPTKVKTITVYVTIEPDFDKKTVKVTDSNGKSKDKEQKIPSTKKKSNTLKLNLGEQEEVAIPPTPTVEVLSDQSLKLTITGYTYSSNFARSVGVQVFKNGKKVSDTLREMKGTTGAGAYTWVSTPMKDGNYYQYRLKGFNHNNLEGNESKWGELTDKVYSKPKTPTGDIYAQNGIGGNDSPSDFRPNIVVKDTANKYDMIKAYKIEYSIEPKDLKQDRYDGTGISGYKTQTFEKGINPESGIFKPDDVEMVYMVDFIFQILKI